MAGPLKASCYGLVAGLMFSARNERGLERPGIERVLSAQEIRMTLPFVTPLSAVPAVDGNRLEKTPARPARSFARRLLFRIIRSRYRRARLLVAQHEHQRLVHFEGPAARARTARPDSESRPPRFSSRLLALLRASAEVWSDARAHQRVMAKRHPIIDC
jgi:hypothetical protein